MDIAERTEMIPPQITQSVPPLGQKKPDVTIAFAVLCIVFGCVGAYCNALRGPFIFQDWSEIVGMAGTADWRAAIFPDAQAPLSGMPLTALTFLANANLGGRNVLGFHVLNLVLHVLCALALFSLAREIFRSPRLENRFGGSATLLGGATALVWSVHPLNTESVNYLSLRSELLVGLCYFSALFAFARSMRASQPIRWRAVSVIAGLAGSFSGSGLVSLPLMIAVMDGVFFASSWKDVWSKRWGYYLALLAVSGVVAVHWIEFSRARTAFGEGVDLSQYFLRTCQAVVLCLKLSVWPNPLVFDYGRGVALGVREMSLHLVLAIAVVGLTVYALVRRFSIGFAGIWLVVFLGPLAGLFPLLDQPLSEHRAYLALPAVSALAVVGLFRVTGKRMVFVMIPLAAGLSVLTIGRNRDYRTEAGLWEDTIIKQPVNARAFLNRGAALERDRHILEAIENYQIALIVDPEYVDAHYALALRLAKNPARQEEAIQQYREVVRIKPDSVDARVSLANLLIKVPARVEESAAQYRKALELKPGSPEIHANLGNALSRLPGRRAEAEREYREALKLQPSLAEPHFFLAVLLAREWSRSAEAIQEFDEALRLNPNLAAAHYNLAVLLSSQPNRQSEAAVHYEAAIVLQPEYLEAHYNLGLLLAKDKSRTSEALAHFEAALRIDPDLEQAHRMIEKLSVR